MENNLPGNVRNKLIARLEKAMALQEGATTQGELEAATTAVINLLDKLGLAEDQARRELDAKNGTSTKAKIVIDKVAWIEDKRTTWEMDLATSVAVGTKTSCIWMHDGAAFVGTEVDTAAATFLWAQLAYRLEEMSQTATTAFAREWKKANGGKSAYKSLGQAALKKYRRNWLAGAVQALRTRLSELAAAASSDVKALVVVKNALIEEKMAELRIELGLRTKHISYVNSNQRAKADGYKAGNEMDIHKGLGSGKRVVGFFLDGD